MRSQSQYIASAPMPLVTESGEVFATFRQIASRIGRKCRHAMCSVLHGGHELYRARTDTKLYQQCLLCGYETTGWTIDRRDRQLQLVSAQPSEAAGRG